MGGRNGGVKDGFLGLSGQSNQPGTVVNKARGNRWQGDKEIQGGVPSW